MFLKAKKVWCSRFIRINRRIDLFKLQAVLNKHNIFCYAEGNDRYLIARGNGFTTKIFPNGTLCITHKGTQLPGNFHKILNLIKTEVEGWKE